MVESIRANLNNYNGILLPNLPKNKLREVYIRVIAKALEKVRAPHAGKKEYDDDYVDFKKACSYGKAV
jgi:hypothetical protein